MARTKKDDDRFDSSKLEPADNTLAETLSVAFERVITEQYGYARAPKPYMTPFGIQHLDALLGGGIVSSAPVILSSTPETGKSTLAFQFSSIFQKMYPNSIVVYLDIEAAGNTAAVEGGMSRIHTFEIDEKRFRYEPILVDVVTLFSLIDTLCEIKATFEQKSGKEFKVLIVWDSIASTPSSKTEFVDDVNKVIGVKARQLTFCLEKYAAILAHKRITFLAIDQVRANLTVDPYAQKERTVGLFKDYRAATAIQALNHKVSQWLFLSRKTPITPDDGIGVNGWYMTIFTEKNKNAPSQEAVTCVFDKIEGLHKFWSEYTFLSELTPFEKKYYKDESKLIYPLSIKKAGSYVYLEFVDPTTGVIQYKSDKFYRKDAFKLYKSNENFRQAFDYITSVAVDYRIKQGLFQRKSNVIELHSNAEDNIDQIEEENGSSNNQDDSFDDLADEGTYQSIF